MRKQQHFTRRGRMIRFSDDEWARVRRAAKKARAANTSEWIRNSLNALAARILKTNPTGP